MRSIVALRWSLPTILLFASLSTAEPTRAATFCVGTVAELEAAMVTARTNGESDTIRVRQGTYALASSLDLGFFSGEDDGKSLSLIGGHISFLGGCPRLSLDPSTTVLQEEGVWAIRWEPNHGPSNPAVVYRIEGLTFDDASVLLADNATSSNYRFELVGNRIHGNGGSAVRVTLKGESSTARIVNNLFDDNIGLGTGVLEVTLTSTTATAQVVHNTFANNEQASGHEAFDAFCSVAGSVSIENNLFWNNQPLDLSLEPICISTVGFNNLPSLVGSPDFGCCNVDLDPAFEDAAAGNYRLSFGSAVRNLGDLAPDGGLPAFDLEGNPRLDGALPDLGAYEVPWIFADGFESGTTGAWSLAVP